MDKSRCVVIGAGSVGVNLALFLDKWGFEVTLIEREADILRGAAQVSFINHGDGFEYYKPRHQRTGKYCIEGSLTKALIYPLKELSTDVCSVTNPIRFFVAKGAVLEGLISKRGFLRNAEDMMSHYTRKFNSLKDATGMSEGKAIDTFLRPPMAFMRSLNEEEVSDAHEIVAGVSGNGFGINMPNYYALLKAALQRSGVSCHYQVGVERITRLGSGDYEVQSGGCTWKAAQIFLCSAHHIPSLSEKIRGVGLVRDFPGTYYLNSMTFITLPATCDKEKLRLVTKINFTLMERFGCMYACIVAPTKSKAGVAAIYYPDPNGSQHARHASRGGEVSKPPSDWDALIERGLSKDERNVKATFRQACKVYPFLGDYARISHSMCRTVFNIGVRGSDCGLDRRVRELSPHCHLLTTDGQISAWTGSKWTTAELTACMALDHAVQQIKEKPLPKDTQSGCGPTNINVASLSGQLRCETVDIDPQTAQAYARHSFLSGDD